MNKGYTHVAAAPIFDKIVFSKVDVIVYRNFSLRYFFIASPSVVCMNSNIVPTFQVKEGLGGNMRLILSGAAPLSTAVETFLRVVTCADVLQGYGNLLTFLSVIVNFLYSGLTLACVLHIFHIRITCMYGYCHLIRLTIVSKPKLHES